MVKKKPVKKPLKKKTKSAIEILVKKAVETVLDAVGPEEAGDDEDDDTRHHSPDDHDDGHGDDDPIDQSRAIARSQAVERRQDTSPAVARAAQVLLTDCKNAISRGLSSSVAHGAPSVRFTLDTEEEINAAMMLEHQGYGRLTREAAKGSSMTCRVHHEPFPCRTEDTSTAGIIKRADVCEFEGEDAGDWVFEYTGGSGGGSEGGVLRRRAHDE